MNSLARAQFSGCSSRTNAHSETGQMAVCCQTLKLGVFRSCSALSLLVGALFKKFCLFLNMPCTVMNVNKAMNNDFIAHCDHV